MNADEYLKLAEVEDGMWYFRSLHAHARRELRAALGEKNAHLLDAGDRAEVAAVGVTGPAAATLGEEHEGQPSLGDDLDHPVGLQSRLLALEQVEVDGAGQRPVDAGRGDFQQIFASDRVGGVEHLRNRAAQLGALFDRDVVVGGAFGHYLQALAL